MYHVSAQGIGERMINVHYYYYLSGGICTQISLISMNVSFFFFYIIIIISWGGFVHRFTNFNECEICALNVHSHFRFCCNLACKCS